LVGYFAGNFKDDVEKEEGNMAIEISCRAVYTVGYGCPDENEQVVKEGGPSVDIRA